MTSVISSGASGGSPPGGCNLKGRKGTFRYMKTRVRRTNKIEVKLHPPLKHSMISFSGRSRSIFARRVVAETKNIMCELHSADVPLELFLMGGWSPDASFNYNPRPTELNGVFRYAGDHYSANRNSGREIPDSGPETCTHHIVVFRHLGTTPILKQPLSE